MTRKLRLVILEDPADAATIAEALKLSAEKPNTLVIASSFGVDVEIDRLKRSFGSVTTLSAAAREPDAIKSTVTPAAMPNPAHVDRVTPAVTNPIVARPSRRRLLICRERPGEKFTIAQAATLAGIGEPSMGAVMAPSALKRRPHPKTGLFHFLPEGSEFPHDFSARPRSSGTSMPINPRRLSAVDTTPAADFDDDDDDD